MAGDRDLWWRSPPSNLRLGDPRFDVYSGRGLPSGDLPPEPSPVWNALMPQSGDEREARHWRNSLLPWMAWLLPPVAAFQGGQNMAQGVAERDPLRALMGLGQTAGAVVWPAPSVTNLPASVTSRLHPALGGTRGAREAPSGVERTVPPARAWQPSGLAAGATAEAQSLYRDLSRHYAATGDAEAMRLLQQMERGITPATRELYALAPAGQEGALSGVQPPPPPRTVPGAVEEFHALQPPASFPRIEGTTAVDARNAYMALRQAGGDYDRAIAALGIGQGAIVRNLGASNILRAWQARGVDPAQALSYWRGLAQLRDLERPTRLNSIGAIGAAGLGGGLGLDQGPAP